MKKLFLIAICVSAIQFSNAQTFVVDTVNKKVVEYISVPARAATTYTVDATNQNNAAALNAAFSRASRDSISHGTSSRDYQRDTAAINRIRPLAKKLGK